MTTLSEAHNIFKVLDNENKGYITVDKFIASFHEFYNNNEDDDDDKVTQENTLKNLISKMQPDNNGRIQLQNFLSVFQQVQSEENNYLKAKRYSQYSIKRFLSAESFEEPSEIELSSLNENPVIDCEINGKISKTDANSNQSDNRLETNKIHNSKVTSSCKNLLENHTLLPSAAIRARDLFSAGASPRGSDIHPGMLTHEIGSNFDILQMQMKRLEQKLNSFHSDQYDLDKKQSLRIKEENKNLNQRVNNLEDSLRELEERTENRLSEEKKEFQKKLIKAEEEKRRELETVQNRIYKFEGESADFSLEIRQYKDESDKQRAEKHALTEKLTESDMRLSSLQEEFDRLRSQSKSSVENLKKEKERYERILIELNAKSVQLLEKPQIRIHAMNNLSQQHKELEDLLEKLKAENKALLNQIEESNSEIRERKNKENRDMINSTDNLSRELENCSKEELMDILAKGKDSNFRLRDYIEKIIVKVMEKNPALLEVGPSKK